MKDNIGISIFVDNFDLIEVASRYPVQKIYFDPSYSFNTLKIILKTLEIYWKTQQKKSIRK